MLAETAPSYSNRTAASSLKSLSLAVVHHVLAVTPILPLTIVYLFSWRLQSLIGHWPIYMVDDPKFVGPSDSLASLLYSSVLLSGCLTFFSIFLFPIVTYFRWRNYPRWRNIALISAYIICWILSRYDPAQRWQWYMD